MGTYVGLPQLGQSTEDPAPPSSISAFILPPSSFATNLTYYVDGWAGDNANDGLTKSPRGPGHGPVRNIAAALAISGTGDTIKVAAGFYQELNWLPSGQNLELATNGPVFISDADPHMTSSANDGIPDAWVAAYGLSPFDYSVAGQTSTHPFAHGLTNLQVYQHPSVLIADNFSTVRDGIPDWWKVKYGMPVNDPGVAYSAANHTGYSNLQEYQNGLTPTDPTSYPTNSLPDVAGWWPFDEGSGSNTISMVGTNLTGTRVGDPLPIWTSGVYSNALGYDGIQNEVVVADDPQLSPTNMLSVSAWVQTATNITSAVVSKWSTNSAAGSYLLSLTNGQVMLELMLSGTYTSVVGQASSLSDTNWHHITGTYDGTNMQVYLDGASVNSLAASGTVDVVDAPLRMGLLSGQLDDVRLYNLALPPDGVSGLVNADSVGDGIPDWWRKRYFGSSGTTNSSSCASCDPDGDGFSNLEEYLAGTNPNDASSKPNVHPIATLTIPNAWAVYTSSNTVQVTTDIRSTNQYVAIKAAEFFVDRPRATGTGIAMNLNNSGRDWTNVTATGTFMPAFSSGERHEIFIHAQGKDKQWCRYKKILINPNVNDVLDKVATNYSQIQDLTVTLITKHYVEDDVISTETVVFRQKGAYKMRWDYQTTGAITIINNNAIGVLDENGQLTPMYIATGDDASVETNKNTLFYWDVTRFQNQHNIGTITEVANTPGHYRFTASPKQPMILPYASLNAEVDFRNGTVTTIGYSDVNGSPVLSIEQPTSQEIAPGVWFHSQHNEVVPVDAD